MRKLHLLTLLTIIIMGYSSCKKEDSQPGTTPVVIPTPEGRFVVSQTLKLEKPVMYTRNSVITDIQYIQNFLLRDTVVFTSPGPWPQPIDDGFIFDQLTQQSDMGIEINFATQDSVKISFSNLIFEPYPNPVTKIFFRLNDSAFILKDTGTSRLNTFVGTNQNSLELRHKLEKTNDNETLVYYYHQFGTIGTGKFNLSLKYLNGKFYMPVIRYRFSLRGGNPVNPSRSTLNNSNSWILMNPGIQAHLGQRDTIIVQTKLAELVR